MSSGNRLGIGKHTSIRCMSKKLISSLSDIWFTLTFANNPSIFSKIVEYHAQFVSEWKSTSSDPDFITQCMFQAIPTVFSEHSVKNGGNVLGLDKEPNNAIMLLLDIAVKSADLEVKAREMLDRYGLLMKEAAKSEGGFVEWTYLNYADGWQVCNLLRSRDLNPRTRD